jgi:hypothetical protein
VGIRNRSWTMHLMAVTNKGADARRAGLPKESPYTMRSNLNRCRAEAWLDGWDCADREIREAEIKREESDG